MAALTVLMPVYNAERFLAGAIDSILNQTFTDFEFLIIDDCSTDSSVAIIESYPDKRIRFYRNEKNCGISATLNKGITLANTDWIARMDSDDISYPNRLQQQVDFISKNPDGALYSCWVKVVGQDGRFIRQDNFKSPYYYYNLTFICWIYHPSIVINKQAALDVGMYTVPYAEDFELFWQLTRTYKIYNLAEVLLDYRVTDQSLHQVLKKKEYEAAQYEQLLRNLRYYAGEDYTLPRNYIDCLQHNFQPLLAANSVAEVVACIEQLDFLTEKILAKENINRNEADIREAAFFKRRFIIGYFSNNLAPIKALQLLLKLREYKYLERWLKDGVKRRLRLGKSAPK